MLDDDLREENLYLIASGQDPSKELLEEIRNHPACYPKLDAWAEYVEKTGTKIDPPPPPAMEAPVEVEDPSVDDVTAPPLEPTGHKRGLLRGKNVESGAPLPVKNQRMIFAVAGIAGVLLVGAVISVVVLQAGSGNAKAAPTPAKTVTAQPVIEKALTVSGDGFVCSAKGKTVTCLGQNNLGQLGDGGPSPNHTGKISLVKPVKLLSSGADFVCASSGKGVTCWGDNRWKQSGDNVNPTIAPTEISALHGKTVVSLASGELHTCAITSEKKLYCWGSGFSGQLGDGKEGEKASGVKEMTLPEGQIPLSVTSSRFGSCVTMKSGKTFCWGSNEGNRIAEGEAQYLGMTEMGVETDADSGTQN